VCGICGIISPDGVTKDDIQQMADIIAHRGPDDQGYYIDGSVGLGHRRLSIIDLDGGRQPLCNEDGSIWIVFNGEIYNFKSVKAELVARGHKFRTNTDTEVIVHLYEEEGERFVERLAGMFAFALWDGKNKKIILARDRIGQKPLFYASHGRRFIFASEVKSILAEDRIPRQLDYEALHHYLSLRFIPAPHTMFKKINKLPAGHYLIYQNGDTRIKRYWDLDFRTKLKVNEEDCLDLLDEQLKKSVESHLISDVPVGAYLSGGMDTSMVVALMANTSHTSFKTFSIGVKEQDYNELPYARVVSDVYKSKHIERIVTADIVKLAPQMIWYLDEPSDPIAACMFHAAKLASENVKVVLGGDGGDELFAGFDRYLGMGLIDHYNLIPSLIRERLISPIVHAMPDSFTYKSITQKLRWVDYLSRFDSGIRYAEATSFFRFNHEQKALLFSDRIWQQLENINSMNVISDCYDGANADKPIDRMLYADIMTRLSEHTLMLTDRMNMAHGLEARSPFLDHPLVELLATFPSSIKIRGRQLKYVLRRLGKKYLPAKILNRKKQGFMFPVAYWFRNELHGFLKSFFDKSIICEAGLIQRDYINRLIEEHKQNRMDHHVRIWMLFNFDLWYRMFIQNETYEHVTEMVDRLTVETK
jgi:asparagine synthase (glutamine-hydrolysing)